MVRMIHAHKRVEGHTSKRNLTMTSSLNTYESIHSLLVYTLASVLAYSANLQDTFWSEDQSS